ncbi:tetratricopeptide repeat protein [Panacibacter sp. DH6]|uniref:Tetratricopeptide repeat protein n=1 Tax=Panacibacter microcysteis TaxID=2793269 RepID=A0A931E3R8_9BACT|nr:tetratricopeptide repeat protein [Panacibacter microcysteis]MBG9375587.1 tetratricopeptide repeat protein [Panacibacter microcysteis]
MKNYRILLLAFMISSAAPSCRSGLVTMTNGCYNAIEAGQRANKAGEYSKALDQFNQVLDQCKAYDAKEKGYAGKAAALNGMQQYTQALEAANQGLAINKASIDNYFEKANAELGLKKSADAKASFAAIIDLTQKNQNVKDRATIYAKIAEIDLKQNMYTDAVNNIEQAIKLDESNVGFYMLRGDIKTAQKDFKGAIADYDFAIAKGKDDYEAWKAKAFTYIKSYQEKYATADTKELARRLSQPDKQILCGEIAKAKAKGVKDVNMDLLELSLCK